MSAVVIPVGCPECGRAHPCAKHSRTALWFCTRCGESPSQGKGWRWSLWGWVHEHGDSPGHLAEFRDPAAPGFNPWAPRGVPTGKADQGKPRFDLIPPNALLEVAKVLAAGVKEHGEEGWRTLENGRRRYLGAGMRHIEAFRRGEVTDKSGSPALAHAVADLLIVLELELVEVAKRAEGNG